MSMKHR